MTTLDGAFASALNEAILRVTDGQRPLDEAQLAAIAREMLWGERVFSPAFEVNLGADTVVIRRVVRDTPAADRRPAPTFEEAWATLPAYLREREAEHRASADPEDRKWLRVPQPLYSPDTPFNELPKRIIRQCCESKTCGGTDLYLERVEAVVDGTPATYFEYRRGSNDEVHFGASTLEELIEKLNDPARWPNQWAPYVFELYPGDEGFVFNAPDGLDG